MKGGVYLIRCVPTGMIYVGAGKRLSRRMGDHRRALNRQKHWCKALQNAWSEYGEAQFSFEVLERAESDALLALEQRYLDDLQPYGERGFNTRKRANKARRDTKLPPEEAARWAQAFKGKKHTAEARERIRQAKLADNWQRGRPWTETQRQNTTRHKGEAHHYFGQQRSEAVKRAISDKLSNRVAQITKDGKLVRIWRSANDAAKELGLKNGGAIRSACNGKLKTSVGFRWSYVQAVEMQP